ncbi:Cytochrome P450 [Dillenia turbinata]|uniref:Cytochrome P450 n=1 Tax=Dillenia turbinata TaxID=194707 RepID=A0AAN8UTS6_9MAGN
MEGLMRNERSKAFSRCCLQMGLRWAKNRVPAMTASVEVMLERWRNHRDREIERKLMVLIVLKNRQMHVSVIGRSEISEVAGALILLVRRDEKIKESSESSSNKQDDGKPRQQAILKLGIEPPKPEKQDIMMAITSECGFVTVCSNVVLYIFEKATQIGFILSRNNFRIQIPVIRKLFRSGDDAEADELGQSIRCSILEIVKSREKKDMRLLQISCPGRVSLSDAHRLARKSEERGYWNNGGCILQLQAFQELLKRELCSRSITFPADIDVVVPPLFAEGIAKATRNNNATCLSFGWGPSICVGVNFAANEAEIALSMILQCYMFTLSATYVRSPVHLLTVLRKLGVQIKLHAT